MHTSGNVCRGVESLHQLPVSLMARARPGSAILIALRSLWYRLGPGMLLWEVIEPVAVWPGGFTLLSTCTLKGKDAPSVLACFLIMS